MNLLTTSRRVPNASLELGVAEPALWLTLSNYLCKVFLSFNGTIVLFPPYFYYCHVCVYLCFLKKIFFICHVKKTL